MNASSYTVCKTQPEEFAAIGQLMVEVYSQLDGFLSPQEPPEYYKLIATIEEQTKKLKTELLVAVTTTGKIGCAVVYFDDMQYYGSGVVPPR